MIVTLSLALVTTNPSPLPFLYGIFLFFLFFFLVALKFKLYLFNSQIYIIQLCISYVDMFETAIGFFYCGNNLLPHGEMMLSSSLGMQMVVSL